MHRPSPLDDSIVDPDEGRAAIDMTPIVQATYNRGYNLMVMAVLLVVGLSFLPQLLNPAENDWGDRLDDLGLPVIGLAAALWYAVGGHRYKRSPIPVLLAAVAMGVQIAGFILERDDSAAYGDNIEGMIAYTLFLLFFVLHYGGVVRLNWAPQVSAAAQRVEDRRPS